MADGFLRQCRSGEKRQISHLIISSPLPRGRNSQQILGRLPEIFHVNTSRVNMGCIHQLPTSPCMFCLAWLGSCVWAVIVTEHSRETAWPLTRYITLNMLTFGFWFPSWRTKKNKSCMQVYCDNWLSYYIKHIELCSVHCKQASM